MMRDVKTGAIRRSVLVLGVCKWRNHGVSDIRFEDGRDILIDVLTAEVEHKGDNVFWSS
jgi:hypothetical protein